MSYMSELDAEIAGSQRQYSLEVQEYGLKDEQHGTCPKGERFCLFIKYLPNPLASQWKFFKHKYDALQARNKWVAKINKEV